MSTSSSSIAMDQGQTLGEKVVFRGPRASRAGAVSLLFSARDEYKDI